MKKKVRFLTDISFSEISGVDKPANDLATVQAIQVAKRADTPELNETLLEEMEATPEEIGILRKAFSWLFQKKAMTGKSMNDLPDSAFAYIEPGGKKDSEGKTTPRSKRHFPVHDAAHTRNALARMSQSPFGDKAKAKVHAAAKKFGIEVSEDKVAESGDLRKSLYDVGQLAQCVQTLASLAFYAENERESEGDDSKIPDRLAAARDELGDILVAMAEEEVGELGEEAAGNGGGIGMALSAKVEELLKQMRESGALTDGKAAVEKAKMSAANMNNLKMCKGHMSKMGGCLDKASSTYPDDDDISSATAHHAAAMSYMGKMDLGPTEAQIEGSKEDKTPADMIAASTKVEDLLKAATDSLRADFSKQIDGVKSQLDEAVKKSHALEVENATLKGKLSTLEKLPAAPRAVTFSPTGARPMALTKGTEGADAAGGGQADDEPKVGDPNGFTKAFRRAISHPGSVRDPHFNGSMGKGA